MQTSDWLFMFLVFATVVFLVGSVHATWLKYFDPRGRVMGERLKNTPSSPSGPATLKLNRKRVLSTNPAIEKWLQNISGVFVLDTFLLQTGLSVSVSQLLLVVGALVLMLLIAGVWLHLPGTVVLLMMVAALTVVGIYLQHRRTQRIVQIEQQMPDALDLIVRSMQAGHAFPSALHIAADDSRAPLSVELRTVFDEINFGTTTAQALQGLARRVTSEEVLFFVVAVLIQSETGGNLADILKKSATLIRERQKIAGTVRVLSAEGRISAIILSLLPFALAGMLTQINPEFMAILWKDPMGLQMVWAALTLMVVGMFWMWKMVQIRV